MSHPTKENDLNLDQKRLAYLATVMDGLGGRDFHADAAELATIYGRAEPTERDYYYAVCVSIDSLMNPI